MNTTPKFSILHTSARPGKWREIYEAWLAAADHPEAFEYVLVVDERWGFPGDLENRMYANMRAQDSVHFNGARRCYVDGVNTAAAFATGDTFIVIADDQYPAPHWDTLIGHAVDMARVASAKTKYPSEYVLWANTGTPSERERNIIVMPILARDRYSRLGYVFYEQYESMYADNDFCEHAKHDGILYGINPTLGQPESESIFPHRHPFFTDAAMDEAYEAQNRQEAYSLGAEVFNTRRNAEFTPIPPVTAGAGRKHLAVCLPGRHWPLEFMSAWTDLVMRLLHTCNFTPIFGSASDPGVVREVLARRVMNDLQLPADFVLWIDNDNVLPYPFVMQMLKTLHERPEITAVAAWCWLLHPAGAISCGHIDDKGHIHPLNYTAMMAAPDDLQEVDYSGFPAILMRREMIEQAGRNPFVPILSDQFEFGKSGEDYAFCVHARAGGARIFVDRRLKIEHLKLGALDGTAAAAQQGPGDPAAANAPADEQVLVPAGEAT